MSTETWWIRFRIILIGAIYPIVGYATGELAAGASTPRVRFLWRLSAFAISGLVFAAHFALEHFRRREAPARTALLTAGAAALGGFLLAAMANLHDLGSPAGYRPRMVLALVLWPLITGVPVFIAARIAAAILPAKRT